MKRKGYLYEQIISMDNLRLAVKEARRRHTKNPAVLRFEARQDELLERLHEQLANQTFTPSAYSTFTMTRPKERLIHRLPFYPDRIVHHALLNILEPIWTAKLPPNMFCCVKGKGIHGGQRCMERIMRSPAPRLYCLKVDIRKFYPSVEHQALKAAIRRTIKCPATLALLDRIIDGINGTPDPLRPSEQVHGRGLAIGNGLSPTLANLLIAPLIRRANALGLLSVCYADDVAFFAPSKEVLRSYLPALRGELAALHLSLKPNWQIFPVAADFYCRQGRGVDMLGYVFFRRHTRLRKGIKRSIRRAHIRGNLAAMAAVCGWASHCPSRHFMKSLTPK